MVGSAAPTSRTPSRAPPPRRPTWCSRCPAPERRCARGWTRSGSTPARRSSRWPTWRAAGAALGRRRAARRACALRARAPRACARAWPSWRRSSPARRSRALRGRRGDPPGRARPPRAARRSTATTTRRSTRSASARWPRGWRAGSGSRTGDVGCVRRAAPLHDLGKIAIPDSILLKPGPLSAEEFEVIKTHAVLGARILEGCGSPLLRGRRAHRPHATTSAGTAAAIPTASPATHPARRRARARRRRLRRARCTSAPTRRRGRSDAGRRGDPRRRGHAVRPGGRGGLRGPRPGGRGRRRVQLKTPDSRPGGFRAMTEAMSRGRTASIAGAAIALGVAIGGCGGTDAPASRTTAAVQLGAAAARAAGAGDAPRPPARARPAAGDRRAPRARHAGERRPPRRRRLARRPPDLRPPADAEPREGVAAAAAARDPISLPTPTPCGRRSTPRVCLVNAERVERGLARLSESQRLAEASAPLRRRPRGRPVLLPHGPRRLGHRRAPPPHGLHPVATGPGPWARTSPGAPARWRRPGRSCAPG